MEDQLKENNSKSKFLLFEDVKSLLIKIDPTLTREEIEFIFNHFDSKRKN